MQLKKKSGEACQIAITLTPLCDARGQVTNIVCSCRPSPEESSKVIPPEAVDATQLLDIAHHLNNVLLTVMAYADLTYGSVPSEHPLRFRLLEIKNSAHRASNLARLLLDCDAMKSLSPLDLNLVVMPAPDSERAPVTAAIGGNSPEFQGANPPTLLVVQDELPVRESMIEFLSKSGYNVLGAGSGEEALEKSRSSAIDLVITDVALPRMSGQQLAGALVAFHPEMKVLFVSGYSHAAVLQRDAPGLNRAFLQKPFSLPALAEKVDGVLAPSQKARAAAAAG